MPPLPIFVFFLFLCVPMQIAEIINAMDYENRNFAES